MSTLYITTGASRGLGAAMVRVLLDEPAELLCLSRGHDEALDALAAARGRRLAQWQVDLARPEPIAERLEQWLRARGPEGLLGVVLINNAAMLETPGPFEAQASSDISRALAVGLAAPLLLTRALLRGTAAWPLPRRLLNISSGLGRRPMAGVSTYCALKAGLDHFSRSLAEEQATAANPLRVVSLAPGIIDTGMQVQLRGADDVAFAAQPVFDELKRSGALDTPEQAAQRVLAFLRRPDFGAEPVADVRG
ncbi:SDR family NAD(P)-dependent oxidoreductase [Aquimonas sp.]|uniref:SDR family NAD(P)-dependent oxidoreductase n=1 Tax=Aquimonas sp. TaxID=1872588 RepID=UPI0037BF82F1